MTLIFERWFRRMVVVLRRESHVAKVLHAHQHKAHNNAEQAEPVAPVAPTTVNVDPNRVASRVGMALGQQIRGEGGITPDLRRMANAGEPRPSRTP